jgi:hypothetical protein
LVIAIASALSWQILATGSLAPRPAIGKISQQQPLKVECDSGFWRCAADQRIAFGYRVQWLWRVSEFAFDQAALAVVADA